MAALSTISKQSGGAHVGDIFSVAFSRIEVIPGFNYRDLTTLDAVATIRAMADDMLDQDIGYNRNKPMIVRMDGDRVLLIDGHRRHKAVSLANSEGAAIEFVPCQSEASGTKDIDRDYELFSTGEPLTIQEKAVGVKRQLNRGQSYEDIARRLKMTVQTVKSWLDLSAAPESILEAINAGEIAATTGRNLVNDHGAGAVQKLAEARVVATAARKPGAKGPTVIRPRHVREIVEREKPRTDPPSLCSFAVTAYLTWEAGVGHDNAMAELGDWIGEAVLNAAREKLRAAA